MEYITLDRYCEELEAGNVSATSNASTTSLPDVYNVTTEQTTTTIFDNFTADINTTHSDAAFREFQKIAEKYVITSFAGLGLIFNIILIIILKKDESIVRVSRNLLLVLMSCEIIYEACIIVFTWVRHIAGLEIMSWVTIPLSLSQMMAAWTIFILLCHTFLTINKFRNAGNRCFVPPNSIVITIVFILFVLFHVPYAPPLRIIIHKALPILKACFVPFTIHWDLFVTPQLDVEPNLLLIYYFFLLQLLFFYFIPMFLVSIRERDIINVIRDLRRVLPTFSDEVCQALRAGTIVAAISLSFVVFRILKFLIMFLKLLDYPIVFIAFVIPVDKVIIFEYINVIGNVLVVFASVMHLPLCLIMMLVNRRIFSKDSDGANSMEAKKPVDNDDDDDAPEKGLLSDDAEMAESNNDKDEPHHHAEQEEDHDLDENEDGEEDEEDEEEEETKEEEAKEAEEEKKDPIEEAKKERLVEEV